MGSLFVMLAPLPLAIGAAADIYVAVEKAAESQALGYAAGIAAICLLLFLWYLQPFLIRMRLRHAKPA
jgi:hypothetical protein